MTLPSALGYASKGLRVFPCAPGKKIPCITHGVTEASTDERQIREWWRRWPGAGIGLVPGPRYFVLDVDTHAPKVDDRRSKGRDLIDGFEGIARLEAQGLILPATLTAQTPSGGLHLWFLAPHPMRPTRYTRIGDALAGLDVRACDSYVVAPPTRIGDGGYTWIHRVPAADPPGWLVPLLEWREPEEPARPIPQVDYEDKGARRWAEVVLDNALGRIRSATARHSAWLAESKLVGGLVGSGLIGEQEAIAALESAARDSLKPGESRAKEIRRTIAGGLEKGKAKPLYPDRSR